VNNDGVERVIDYSGGVFKEIGLNVHPFWTKDDEDYRYFLEGRNNGISSTLS
jgi:hypothetical protein